MVFIESVFGVMPVAGHTDAAKDAACSVGSVAAEIRIFHRHSRLTEINRIIRILKTLFLADIKSKVFEQQISELGTVETPSILRASL